jgi:hypothetical protein
MKLPKGNEGRPRLGKSAKGVYCALHTRGKFEIWFLDESCGQMKWVLQNEINLQHMATSYLSEHVQDGPWILQEQLSKADVNHEDNIISSTLKDEFEWDDANTISIANRPRESNGKSHYVECLGFHPYKEIVLFNWSGRTVAYHLNTSRIRYLGKMINSGTLIKVSFAYAPCWLRDLPGRD